MAPPAGLEPATVGIEARCAIQLRHGGLEIRVPVATTISESESQQWPIYFLGLRPGQRTIPDSTRGSASA